MRPLYETPKNLISEKEAVSKYCKEFGFESFKLPIAYHFDYIIFQDHKACAILEIKVRKEKFGTYPDYMISLSKVLRASEWNNALGIPVLLIVQFYDTAYMSDLTCRNGEVKISGRHDREDSQDIEPCYFIPIKNFVPVY